MDRDASRRAFCGDGAAASLGRGDTRTLPAASHLTRGSRVALPDGCMRIRSVRGNESGLTFRAAIDAGILTRGRHGEPAQVVRPTPIVARALCSVRKTTMGQAQQSAAVTLDQIDLDQARSR